MMSTPKQRAVLREREHTNSIASYVLLMLLMLLLRGGNRSATERRQRVNHMVQRQHPLGTCMQTSHVRMCSAQQSSSSFSSFCSSSYRCNLLREDRCLSDHGECRYLEKGECRMTWMCQKVRRKRWCMDVALRQPRVSSSSILFAVAYRRRHPSLSAATFHSWRSTTAAATADKIRFTRIQILCPPCDGSLVHIKNETAACPLRERERERENPRGNERTCVRGNDDIVDRSGGG